MSRTLTVALAIGLALFWIGCDSGSGPNVIADPGSPAPDAAAPGPESDTTTSPDVASGGDGTADPGDATVGPDLDPDPDPDPDPIPELGEPCPLSERVGHFEISHNEFYAAITGTVSNGVIPLTVLQPVTTAAGCTLLQKKNPFCDPPCGAGELCDHDSSCIPYPENLSVGTVSVTGLLKDAVSMEPNAQDYYWDPDVPFPLFEAGSPVELTASGADGDGFSLSGIGVPDLVLADSVLTMMPGQPLQLTWDAEEGPWRIWFSLNIDQHGNAPVTLFCDVEDTGSATVAADMVDAMLNAGVSGFASAHFRRQTVDSTEIAPGCAQLSVYSFAPGKLAVEGHTPCKFDPDCPEGQVCDVLIETCVEAN